jgi:lipopolysaccharide transport system ATP-binding protein
MMISAEYKSQEESALKNFLVSFVITDVLGQILFLFSTELTAPDAQAIPANGTLRCIVPRLPLSGGFYQIGCHLRVNGVIQDNINHAGRLEVVDGNFYGTGRLYPPGWQGRGVLVEHKWLLPVLPG